MFVMVAVWLMCIPAPGDAAVVAALRGYAINASSTAVQEGPSDRMTIAIVWFDTIDHPTARTKVVRRKGEALQNVIIVTRQTTPSDLQRAVIALAASHKKHGSDLPNNLVAYVGAGRPITKQPASGDQSNGARRLRETNNILRRLPTVQQIQISGYGAARAVIYETRSSHWLGDS